MEADAILSGWSIKRSILRKPVFNENVEIGTIYDIVVAPDKSVSYAIIDAREFVWVANHNLAVPVGSTGIRRRQAFFPSAALATDALAAQKACWVCSAQAVMFERTNQLLDADRYNVQRRHIPTQIGAYRGQPVVT
ncbi:PRC-barrel domain-containing protein [Paraburkholderia xenovorans]|uniref:PRC-barrel domain-containing protein n=1 Tax=Paraburkholderia xenovorans TaxID=36873 RepID=UPI0038BC6A58